MIIDYRLCAYFRDKSGPGSITYSCFKCYKTYNQPIKNGVKVGVIVQWYIECTADEKLFQLQKLFSEDRTKSRQN